MNRATIHEKVESTSLLSLRRHEPSSAIAAPSLESELSRAGADSAIDQGWSAALVLV